MINAADLPDDIAALKAMLLASQARTAHLEAELSTRTAEIEHLKLVLAKLKRMQFGRSSEKLDRQIEQLELKLEDLEAEEVVAEAQAPLKVAPRKARERKPLPPTCRARSRSIHHQAMPARLVVAACAHWARTWRNNWSSSLPASV